MNKISEKQAYHHGDLREALIATGLRLLEAKGGEQAIGLREIARETGVSATAVYRHFPDKDALFAALAAEGFGLLADAQERAAAGKENPRAAFRAIGQAYVHFALDNPALFRLMTSHMHMTGSEEGRAPDNRAALLLRNQVAGLLGEDADESRIRITALQAWALVHGLAMLMLGDQVPARAEIIESVVDEFEPFAR